MSTPAQADDSAEMTSVEHCEGVRVTFRRRCQERFVIHLNSHMTARLGL